jgi:hypothetical protein
MEATVQEIKLRKIEIPKAIVTKWERDWRDESLREFTDALHKGFSDGEEWALTASYTDLKRAAQMFGDSRWKNSSPFADAITGAEARLRHLISCSAVSSAPGYREGWAFAVGQVLGAYPNLFGGLEDSFYVRMGVYLGRDGSQDEVKRPDANAA